MREFNGLDDFETALGTHLGFSEWRTVTQEQINEFADVTDDRQWIHIDVEKAAEGPFGTTIAHGFLTLSLVSALVGEIFAIQGLSADVNYGLNKVRFPAVLPAGGKIRAGAELAEIDRDGDRARAVVRVVVELEGSERPVCIADTVALLIV